MTQDTQTATEIADTIAEAVKRLNHATINGLHHPSHVYDVLGALQQAAARLPQSLQQMATWTEQEIQAGRARDHHRPATTTAAALREAVTEAVAAADRLAGQLAAAQTAVSNLYSAPEADE